MPVGWSFGKADNVQAQSMSHYRLNDYKNYLLAVKKHNDEIYPKDVEIQIVFHSLA